MRTWLTSLQGAIALSVIAMLSFVAYAFLVSRYVLEELTPGMVAASVETLVVIAIVGGWTWGLLAAARGSRPGLIAALVFSLLPAWFTLYDLVLVFSSPIRFGWPLLQIVVWITFVACVIAIAAVSLRLRQERSAG